VILAGHVDLIRNDEAGGRRRFHTTARLDRGELAQLGRAALVDVAHRNREALIIPPERLRARWCPRGTRRTDMPRPDPASVGMIETGRVGR